MKRITVNSLLNDTALRADWPKMSDLNYEWAIRIAAAVGSEMNAEPEDESVQPTRELLVTFRALRKVLPRPVLHDIRLPGPRFMDFSEVINEVSGLAVVHAPEGFLFLDLLDRKSRVIKASALTELMRHVNGATVVLQFAEDEDWDGDEDDTEIENVPGLKVPSIHLETDDEDSEDSDDDEDERPARDADGRKIKPVRPAKPALLDDPDLGF